ncbi:hypothetical protein NX059_008991 [Plenodomus lindquistii]|nr:hypothetical protein NX059_008991 [Plenodomus lindquistii]
MAASQVFKRAVYVDQNSVSTEYYHREEGNIFEKEEVKVKIEVRCRSACDLTDFSKCGTPIVQFATAPLTTVERGDYQSDAFVGNHLSGNLGQSDDSTHNATEPVGSGALVCASRNQPLFSSVPLVTINLDPEQLRRFVQLTSHAFRVFYIRQENSFSQLQVTKNIFNGLMNECQVFPQFRDFLLDFKWKTKECEIAPPRIKFRPDFNYTNGYTGQRFETAYIIRFMEFTNRTVARPWSLRQFAVYHRSIPDIPEYRSTWILVGSSRRTEDCVGKHAESLNNSPHTNPFELHIMFLDIVIASWRPYLQHLLERVELSSTKAVLTAIGGKGTLRDVYEVDEKDFQKLKTIEDQTCDALLCLDSTLDTVNTLTDMYHQCYRIAPKTAKSVKPIAKGPCVTDPIWFALVEKQKDIAYARKKVEALLAKICNTRSLISTLLERRNGFNLHQQMSALQSLQRQGQEENAIMRQLAEKGSRDSASVRILTIITLIYLPCTVVSVSIRACSMKQHADDTIELLFDPVRSTQGT